MTDATSTVDTGKLATETMLVLALVRRTTTSSGSPERGT
jgi:hypothetical protein